MKLPALITLLLTLLFCSAAHCQEAQDPDLREFETAERHMHQRERQMDLEAHESELDFQRQMRQLELDERRMELDRRRAAKKHNKRWKHKEHDNAAPLLIVIAIVNILTAIWVYQDIRKRGVGSGIWIVLALLTGLLGTLVYAVVRLGNTPQTPK
ncbi:MAG: hypothetical protein JSW23_10530 [Planctomycetota bacterium]|nr:MAG: hypothetical protein JSW23_10530 [Planctomycetota bacterium]